MTNLDVHPPVTSVDITLPGVSTTTTRPGMDAAGAAIAAALIQQTKDNMDNQFAQYNFLNVAG